MTRRGTPPHMRPWPDDERLDTELLAEGDYRNVEDNYRYWRIDAIREDMAKRSFDLEVAIENLERDFNIGTIVRNANAFNVRRVHIIGRKQWNKRGAMMTDTYLDVIYHKTIDEFITAIIGKSLIAVDNVQGSVGMHDGSLPLNCVLVFGGEGPGLSAELLTRADRIVAIPQFGSTRSINVGVASGILMYKWVEQHILLKNN